MLKIYITSFETGEGAWRTHEQELKRLISHEPRATLVDDPASADLILIGNLREELGGARVLAHPLIRQYAEKSFSLSDHDQPLYLHHGIYASATRALWARDRVRSGSYTLYGAKHANPFIQAHPFSPDDARQRSYLFSFIGRNSHWVRHKIFRTQFSRPDVFVENTTGKFDLYDQADAQRQENQRHYYEILLRSKFALCPRGNGANSARLFEALSMGVVPVILSDDWKFPAGPQWKQFSILIGERNVKELEHIVTAHENSAAEMGLLARQAYEAYFSEEAYFGYVLDNCLAIRQQQRIPERVYFALTPVYLGTLKVAGWIDQWRNKLSLRRRFYAALGQGLR